MKRLKIIMLIVAFVLPTLLLVETLYAICESCENDSSVCSEDDDCDPEPYFYMEKQGQDTIWETCTYDPDSGNENCEDRDGCVDCYQYWLCQDHCNEKEFYYSMPNMNCSTD